MGKGLEQECVNLGVGASGHVGSQAELTGKICPKSTGISSVFSRAVGNVGRTATGRLRMEGTAQGSSPATLVLLSAQGHLGIQFPK